MFTEDELDIL